MTSFIVGAFVIVPRSQFACLRGSILNVLSPPRKQQNNSKKALLKLRLLLNGR